MKLTEEDKNKYKNSLLILIKHDTCFDLSEIECDNCILNLDEACHLCHSYTKTDMINLYIEIYGKDSDLMEELL